MIKIKYFNENVSKTSTYLILIAKLTMVENPGKLIVNFESMTTIDIFLYKS